VSAPPKVSGGKGARKAWNVQFGFFRDHLHMMPYLLAHLHMRLQILAMDFSGPAS
jgi:hypothetical protein